MKKIKIKISIFNRYLIFFIFLLFSYLFYLSIPILYNKESLQKDLTLKLSNEFNLNTSLSSNIIYKILPSPNFEISDVVLSTRGDENFNEFAKVKKLKIYISSLNLYNQKKIKIREINFLNTNFNVNKNTFNYINNYLKKKISPKKIEIKKSKIFFREDSDSKDVIALYTIKKSNLIHDKKNNINKASIYGSIFNTDLDLLFSRTLKKKEIKLNLILKKINTRIKNNLFVDLKKINSSNGNTTINFFNSEIKLNYKIKNNIISFFSEESKVNKNNVKIEGFVNYAPFFYDLNIKLKKVDAIKVFYNFLKIEKFFQKDILLNSNFNGKVSFNIDYLSNAKFFNKASLKLIFMNGKLFFDQSSLILDEISRLEVVDGQLVETKNERKLNAKFNLQILDEKKFYQKLQVSKANRKPIKNIYFEIQKNLNDDNFEVKKFIINQGIKNDPLYNKLDLIDHIDINEIKSLKNWISFKKFANELFAKN